MKKIPFPFYKNSIRKFQDCNKQSEKKCDSELHKYYKNQKINPYYQKNNLLEFNIS